MTSPTGIDPEIRELLQELASDQGARLLRVTPQDARASLYERDRRVFPSAPFLRNAEKKLLEAYRNELGRLLYRWGVVLLFQRGVPALCRYGYQSHPLPDQERVRQEVAGIRAPARAGQLENEVAELLASCLSVGACPDPTEVFVASLRVQPTHRTLRSLGTALVIGNTHLKRGRMLMEDALHQQSFGTDASYSLEAIASTDCIEGNYGAALKLYEAASNEDPDRATTAQAWFAMALQVGDWRQVLASSERLEQSRFDESLLDWYPCALRSGRKLNAWQPTKASLEVAMKHRESAGTRARRILDEFG
jgi:hypothetical protein